MSHLSLYLTSVLIWGSTWLAIKFQLGETPALISIFLRFAIASGVCGALVLFLKKNWRFGLKDHAYFALQGFLNFCLNYILTYESEKYIASGLVAVTFTMMTYFNIIGMRVFYHKPFERRVVIAALMGGVGIALIFSNEFAHFQDPKAGLWGFALGAIATFSASMGNMVAVRNNRNGRDVLATSAWGMLYGMIATALIALAMGTSWQIEHSAWYWGSLFYLAIPGTVIAFWSYLTLVSKIGADRAAYITVMTPIIALFLSVLFENYQITLTTVIGVLVCLGGNYMILAKKPKAT